MQQDTNKPGEAMKNMLSLVGAVGLDASNDLQWTPKNSRKSEPFPKKLWRIIEDAEKSGNSDIISFHPHGKTFAVHDTTRFINELMPRHFLTCRYSSFLRQLNFYGFRRVSEPDGSFSFYHELFVKGKKAQSCGIRRKKHPDGEAQGDDEVETSLPPTKPRKRSRQEQQERKPKATKRIKKNIEEPSLSSSSVTNRNLASLEQEPPVHSHQDTKSRMPRELDLQAGGSAGRERLLSQDLSQLGQLPAAQLATSSARTLLRGLIAAGAVAPGGTTRSQQYQNRLQNMSASPALQSSLTSPRRSLMFLPPTGSGILGDNRSVGGVMVENLLLTAQLERQRRDATLAAIVGANRALEQLLAARALRHSALYRGEVTSLAGVSSNAGRTAPPEAVVSSSTFQQPTPNDVESNPCIRQEWGMN